MQINVNENVTSFRHASSRRLFEIEKKKGVVEDFHWGRDKRQILVFEKNGDRNGKD